MKKILQTMNAIIVSVWHDFFVVVDFIKYTTFFCISDKARLWKKEFESDEEMHITLTRIITQFWMKGVLHCVLIFRTQNHLVFYFCRRLRHDLFLLSILQQNELLQSQKNGTSYYNVNSTFHLNSKRQKTIISTACKKHTIGF